MLNFDRPKLSRVFFFSRAKTARADFYFRRHFKRIFPGCIYFTPMTSTIKIKVAPGGITPPAPRSP
jgi:hypothetical protein